MMSSKKKILLCAAELFYHSGYQATSVEEIVQQCGVAKSNFYYHFKTKDELAFAVMELQAAEYEALAKSTLQNLSLSPRERMEAYFAELCFVQAGKQRMAGCPFGNFAATLPNSQDERTERFRQWLVQFFHRMEEMLAACLIEGMERGEFRNDLPPAIMAKMLLSTMQGLLLLTKTNRDTQLLTQGTSLVQQLLKVP